MSAGQKPAQKCGSDNSGTARERTQFRRRWPVLLAKQTGEDFMCDEVVADELRAEPLCGQKQVHRCCVLPAHGIGAGKIQINLGASAHQFGGDRRRVEGFACLNCSLRVTKPKRCGDGVYRDVDASYRVAWYA